MGADVQGVARQIEEIVRAAGGAASGSRLASRLKQVYPDWAPGDHGASSLREFIRLNVRSVRELDRVGMDVRYGLVEQPSPAPLVSPVNRNIWRVWGSPNSEQLLAVDKLNLTIRARSQSDTLATNEVPLKPPDPAFYRDVGRKFLQNVPSHARASLSAILETTGDSTWWKRWLDALDDCSETQAWWSFRRNELALELARRLKDAGLSDDDSSKVVERIKPVRVERTSFVNSADTPVRLVAAEAIRRMSDAEVRELRLPLGAVLDAVAALKRR